MISTAPGMTDKEAAWIICDTFSGMFCTHSREYVQILQLCEALRIARTRTGSNKTGDAIRWAKRVKEQTVR